MFVYQRTPLTRIYFPFSSTPQPDGRERVAVRHIELSVARMDGLAEPKLVVPEMREHVLADGLVEVSEDDEPLAILEQDGKVSAEKREGRI